MSIEKTDLGRAKMVSAVRTTGHAWAFGERHLLDRSSADHSRQVNDPCCPICGHYVVRDADARLSGKRTLWAAPGAVTCVTVRIAPGGELIGAVNAACGRAPATGTRVAGTSVPREWRQAGGTVRGLNARAVRAVSRPPVSARRGSASMQCERAIRPAAPARRSARAGSVAAVADHWRAAPRASTP